MKIHERTDARWRHDVRDVAFKESDLDEEAAGAGVDVRVAREAWGIARARPRSRDIFVCDSEKRKRRNDGRRGGLREIARRLALLRNRN